MLQQIGTVSDPLPTLGGFHGGSGKVHNCLESAQIVEHTYLDMGEVQVTLQCTVCGKIKVLHAIKEIS